MSSSRLALQRSGAALGCVAEEVLDALAAGEADEAAGELAAAEGEQGGDALDAVGRGDLLVVVDVELGDGEGAGEAGGELVEDGGNLTAGASPGCPEVDDDGGGRLEDEGLPVGVCGFEEKNAGHVSLRDSPSVAW